MRAAIVTALGLLLASCAPAPVYRSTSSEGRQCGNACLSRYHEVRSQCFGSYSCLQDTEAAFRACAATCPDLVQER